MTLVSIIIPAYNKAEYTCRAIDSVLAQDYLAIELIVVDDGSQDNTRQAVAAYGNRLIYIYKENGGACSARNAGIGAARGKYLGFLDCDDLYCPGKIRLSVEHLERNPEFGFVHTGAYFIDHKDDICGTYNHRRSLKEGMIADRLVLGNFICNSTVVTRSSVLEQAGYFDESIFTPGDWDMWLRLAEKSGVGYMPAPLTKYRVTDNYIFNRINQALKEEDVVLQKYIQRHPRMSGRLVANVFSSMHLRFAQAFFLKNDNIRFQEQLRLSLRDNLLNLKAWVLMLCAVVARKYLRQILTRKIIRLGETVNADA